jgi:hypothetical protein
VAAAVAPVIGARVSVGVSVVMRTGVMLGVMATSVGGGVSVSGSARRAVGVTAVMVGAVVGVSAGVVGVSAMATAVGDGSALEEQPLRINKSPRVRKVSCRILKTSRKGAGRGSAKKPV